MSHKCRFDGNRCAVLKQGGRCVPRCYRNPDSRKPEKVLDKKRPADKK